MAVLRVGEVVEFVHQGEVIRLERFGLGAVERGHRLDVGEGARRSKGTVAFGSFAQSVARRETSLESLGEEMAGVDALATAHEEGRPQAGLVLPPAPSRSPILEVLGAGSPRSLRHAEPGAEARAWSGSTPAPRCGTIAAAIGTSRRAAPCLAVLCLHRRAMVLDPGEGLRLLLDIVPRPPPHPLEDGQAVARPRACRGLGKEDDRIPVVGDRLPRGTYAAASNGSGASGRPQRLVTSEHARRQRDGDREPEDEVEQASPPPPPAREADGDFPSPARPTPAGLRCSSRRLPDRSAFDPDPSDKRREARRRRGVNESFSGLIIFSESGPSLHPQGESGREECGRPRAASVGWGLVGDPI